MATDTEHVVSIRTEYREKIPHTIVGYKVSCVCGYSHHYVRSGTAYNRAVNHATYYGGKVEA
jgi:hypothetical protein